MRLAVQWTAVNGATIEIRSESGTQVAQNCTISWCERGRGAVIRDAS
jgi:hypothetical protein